MLGSEFLLRIARSLPLLHPDHMIQHCRRPELHRMRPAGVAPVEPPRRLLRPPPSLRRRPSLRKLSSRNAGTFVLPPWPLLVRLPPGVGPHGKLAISPSAPGI